MWKPIPGTNKAYSANDKTGEIRGNERRGLNGRRLKSVVLKPWTQNSGYQVVSLRINGTTQDFLVHRLVANTFLEQEPGKTDVNHKNGIKTDSRLENLECATRSENIVHGIETGLTQPRCERYHKVHMLDLDGCYECTFDTIKEAAEYVGVTPTQIQYALKGSSRTAGGFMWADDRSFGM